jgi:GT2 family glycosyltransferase
MIQGVAGLYNKWLATTKHLGCLEEDRGQYDSERVACKMDCPIGASLFVSRAFIEDVGLMSEDYFLYFEEIDWTIRGRARGWLPGYCWQARVFHKEGGSTGTGLRKHREISETGAFYFHRNRILFTRKFFPRQLLAVKVSFILVMINYIRMGKGNMLRLIMKAYSGAGFLDKQRP